jgi:3-dehydroquinate dehydratase/shikimate dehydrogenase
MIAVPIVAASTARAIKDMEKASKIADIIELRLDFIQDISKKNLSNILSKKKKKIIVTDRRKRLDLIKEAVEKEADFVDLDLSIGEKKIKSIIKNKKNSKIIVSFHNFQKTDSKETTKKYTQIKKLKADIIKIATLAKSIEDNLLIFNLINKAKKENKKIIAICMGEHGEISRILGPLFGSLITFGSLNNKSSAPGQIDAVLLKDLYRINILKKPKIFGLVGNPVNHSKGIFRHNEAFKKLKLNNLYVNFLVDDLGLFIKTYSNMVSGFSVTIPFKREIMNYLDKVEKNAGKIGAVNTVIIRKKKLLGFNTDLTGSIRAIESKMGIKGKSVLMIGAGGVARAIGFGIIEKKGKLVIFNRTKKKAIKLAKELNCKEVSKLTDLRNIDLIINATSVGMHPNVRETPIKKEILRKIAHKRTVVFDSVYNPISTKLLKEAKELGLTVVDGHKMFIYQANEQFRLFTRRDGT